jgi:hypothetical protein
MHPWKSIVIAGMFLATAGSCKKDNNNGGGSSNNSSTTVDITSPPAGVLVTNGSALTIEGTITDGDILASATLQIRNKATGAILYTANVTTPTSTLYRFLWTWNVTGVTSTFVATIKVTGKDLGGFEGSKEVDVTLEP